MTRSNVPKQSGDCPEQLSKDKAQQVEEEDFGEGDRDSPGDRLTTRLKNEVEAVTQ